MTEVVRHKVVLCSGKASKAGETAFSTNSPTNLIPFKKKSKYQTNMYFSMNRDVNYLIEKNTGRLFSTINGRVGSTSRVHTMPV